MDNNNRAAHGRFLNVKPAVGLLTSTARTFIQDGVTTEYATQVLGKTIDNGRLYAQLLTKSSRVVYSNSAINNNNDIDATVTAAISTPAIAYNQIIPTQVIGSANKYTDNTLTIGNNDIKNLNKIQTTITKNDDDNVVTFIKNTDYISPNNPIKSYNVHTVAVNSVNFNSGEDVAFELLPQSLAQVRNIPLEEKAEVRQSFSVSESSSSSNNNGGNANNNEKYAEFKIQLSPERVRTSIELPTFTVPSGYTFEGIDSGFYGSSENSADNSEEINLEIQQNRIGKQLTSIQIPIAGFTEEEKQLQSVTYYGFADFTTVVGNTVIVFSPNTAPPNVGKVTSIKGEATLRTRIEPTQTVKQHQVIAQTKLLALNSIEEYNRKSKTETTTPKTSTTTTTTTTTTTEQTTTESQDTDEILTQKVPSGDSSTETAEEQSAEELEQKSSILAKEQNSLKYNVSPSVIEASEIQTQTEELAKTPTIQIVAATTASKAPMLSIPSDEDIKKIFASLAAKDKASETVNKEEIREQTAETLTGATTIFFEDDPFQLIAATAKEADIKPSATVVVAATDEVTTENDGNVLTTTENAPEEVIAATTQNTDSEETDDDDLETITDLDDDSGHLECEKGYTLQHTTAFKTLSRLTTFFIPDENEKGGVSTSINDNKYTQTNIYMTCSKMLDSEEITPTAVVPVERTKSVEPIKISLKERNRYLNRIKETTPAPPTTTEEPTTENSSESESDETGSNAFTTENLEGNTIEAVTSSISTTTTTESTNDSDEDEIELIYKTLFTTYTYLTTFFHGYTSSVSSRKEVVTNIVTSTLDMSLIKSDAALADLVAKMSDKTERIEPTKIVNDVKATQTHARKEQAISIEDIFDDSVVESNLNQATPILSDAAIEASQIEGSLKTFYTTYTYYTTIFADGETEIASRTEVYTNFVGPSSLVKPTHLVEEDKIFASKVIENVNEKLNEVDEQRKDEQSTESTSSEEDLDNHVIQPSYSTMVRSAESSAQADAITTTQANDDGENVTTTESTNENVERRTSVKVKKSQKDGVTKRDEDAEESTISVNKFNSTFKTIKLPDTKRVVESIRKQLNNILEDQISSESQNEEILPSSTLLLQTSYTTFTYFTTQYIGDASEVLSRLETITNVVTETLQPTQTIVIPPAALADEPILPTTYFTTFTYWTTLFKEGEVVTLSNTKVISNVVSPTASTLAIDEIFPTARVNAANEVAPSIIVAASPSIIEASTEENAETENDTAKPPAENVIEASIVTPTPVLEPTTYFTTYTYYTTSYVGDDTILNSRYETVTNVVTPSLESAATVATVTPAGRAINLDNVKLNQITDGKGEKKLSKDKLAEKSKEPTVLSLNVGKIVDAEGISTILYTTKAIGTYINNEYTQVTEKTSSVTVDEAKKSSILEATPNYADNKHKTGLVRMIDGKIVANHTTTLYQSKVIGTIIDNRYAQIIESTSSYIIDKTQEASIAPTATSAAIKPTEAVISPSSAVVESSLSDSHSDNDGDDKEEHDEDEVDENGRKKSRLTFTSKKPKFTPIIRPFVSRNRPTFAPKRKNLLASSATIITQTDFTPTIRATPAIGKAETSTRRFSGGSRRASNAPHQANASSTTATPALASGSKRFSRLRPSSTGPSGPSSILPSGSARVIRPSSVRPTQSTGLIGSSRRVGNLFRSSSLSGNRLSILPSSVRFRSNPTVTPSLRDSTTTKSPDQDDGTTEPIETNPEENENNDENKEDEEAISTTTENARRNQNPLLRFRRPLTSGAGNRFQPTSTPRPNPVSVSTRRTPLLQRSRSTQATTTTSTTVKPKARSFQKPPGLAALTNRPRAQSNGLFPPRALFKTTTEANQEEINDVANESNNDGQIAENENEEVDEGAEDSVDPEYDGRVKKAAFTPQSALKSRKRTKRQIDYGTRTLSRYRRPTQSQAAASQAAAPRSSYDDIYYDEVEVPTQRPKTQNTRYTSRYRPTTNENHENSQPVAAAINSNSRIRPTKTAAKTSRAQFTLRSGGEKEVSNSYTPTNSRSSNFRRTQNIGANSNGYTPQTSSRRKPLPTSASSSSRTNKSRLRNYGNSYQSDNRSGRGRTSTTSNSRGTTRGSTRSRGRITSDAIDYEYIPNFDGTITVTHHIPTEVTIPVVNGQNTDYKNVITDKISTEILGPQQYSTTSRAYNGLSLVLTSEATNIVKGATEVTQFFLKETPTSSVTFTPTQINRRKTSFSHIVPSTVYNVEAVVSTIQPQISADAPLANILLSQLLLGNLGGALPQQQQLLGLGGQLPFNPIQATPLAPVTEYKTRPTTYVTTLSNAEPTILTVTFRGKEILTTIYDDSVNVITATEFITDTIVTTPTQQVQPTQNINNLLLQQLLAQQQQQPSLLQSQQQIPLNILMNIGGSVDMDKSQSLLQDSLLTLGKETPQDSFNDKNSKKLDIDEPLEDDIRNDYPDLESYENEQKTEKQRPPAPAPQPPSFLNKPKKVAKPTPLETSIITLYVSGRKPGEFSTVLSTVITTPDALLQKRAIDDQVAVKASQLPDLNDVYNAEGSDIDEIYMPIDASTNDLNFIESSQNGIEYGAPAETQSLESILGDVSNYVTKSFLL